MQRDQEKCCRQLWHLDDYISIPSVFFPVLAFGVVNLHNQAIALVD